MTRYMIQVGDKYVSAVYGPGSGIAITAIKEDASSWVTYERAVAAARVVRDSINDDVAVCSVEEPDYPKSWR
jgi:hypothetical protein